MKTILQPIPFEATHPGEVLKDELDARKIIQKDFAVEIGMKSSKGKDPLRLI